MIKETSQITPPLICLLSLECRLRSNVVLRNLGIGGFSTFSGGCFAREKKDGGCEMVVVAVVIDEKKKGEEAVEMAIVEEEQACFNY